MSHLASTLPLFFVCFLISSFIRPMQRLLANLSTANFEKDTHRERERERADHVLFWSILFFKKLWKKTCSEHSLRRVFFKKKEDRKEEPATIQDPVQFQGKVKNKNKIMLRILPIIHFRTEKRELGHDNSFERLPWDGNKKSRSYEVTTTIFLKKKKESWS